MLAQPLAEQCEVVTFEGQLQQWIARVGVESCRHQEQIRFEIDQSVESALCHIDNFSARCERGDGDNSSIFANDFVPVPGYPGN